MAVTVTPSSPPARVVRGTAVPTAQTRAGVGTREASLPAHPRPDYPRPAVPGASARWMFRLNRLLEPNRLWYRVALWLESDSRRYRAFTRLERLVKGRLFGCRMCGQCALPATAYTCPMTCPKQLRNGPCGGVSPDGRCEVYPELRCVWAVAYERAAQEGRVADLRRLQRPIDQRAWNESAWVNHWLLRDRDLWTEDDGLDRSPSPLREAAGAATPPRTAEAGAAGPAAPASRMEDAA